ncbi:MAG: Zn-dependent alcohol dehydrogenase [Halobacteriales archaeon]
MDYPTMKVETAFVEDSGVEDRWESRGNIVVDEVELDEPKVNEVRVDIKAAGVCHSDWHVATGDLGCDHFPCALGHEGAGVVESVGEGVTHVEPGDHVTLSWIPSCGRCEPCASGNQHLCVRGRFIERGTMLDNTFRMHRDDTDVGQILLLGCYSEAVVVPADSVVKIPDDVPFEIAGLTGCCVATGFGAAVNRANIEPGDTVVHFGFGGVGANAVLGSVNQGAGQIVVVDPIEQKRRWAEQFGATHTVDPDDEHPADVVESITGGLGAEVAIFTGSLGTPEALGEAYSTLRNRGQLISVASNNVEMDHIDFPLRNGGVNQFTFGEKEVRGTVYGGWSPRLAISHLLGLYQDGYLPLDDLITARYDLDGINDAFNDMLEGNNIRGVVEF